jgi:hypothetical protein
MGEVAEAADPTARALRRAQLLLDREQAAVRRRRRGVGVRPPVRMPVPDA